MLILKTNHVQTERERAQNQAVGTPTFKSDDWDWEELLFGHNVDVLVTYMTCGPLSVLFFILRSMMGDRLLSMRSEFYRLDFHSVPSVLCQQVEIWNSWNLTR